MANDWAVVSHEPASSEWEVIKHEPSESGPSVIQRAARAASEANPLAMRQAPEPGAKMPTLQEHWEDIKNSVMPGPGNYGTGSGLNLLHAVPFIGPPLAEAANRGWPELLGTGIGMGAQGITEAGAVQPALVEKPPLGMMRMPITAKLGEPHIPGFLVKGKTLGLINRTHINLRSMFEPPPLDAETMRQAGLESQAGRTPTVYQPPAEGNPINPIPAPPGARRTPHVKSERPTAAWKGVVIGAPEAAPEVEPVAPPPGYVRRTPLPEKTERPTAAWKGVVMGSPESVPEAESIPPPPGYIRKSPLPTKKTERAAPAYRDITIKPAEELDFTPVPASPWTKGPPTPEAVEQVVAAKKALPATAPIQPPPSFTQAPSAGEFMTEAQLKREAANMGMAEPAVEQMFRAQGYQIVDRATINRAVHKLGSDLGLSHDQISEVAQTRWPVKSLTQLSDDQMLELVHHMENVQATREPVTPKSAPLTAEEIAKNRKARGLK